MGRGTPDPDALLRGGGGGGGASLRLALPPHRAGAGGEGSRGRYSWALAVDGDKRRRLMVATVMEESGARGAFVGTVATCFYRGSKACIFLNVHARLKRLVDVTGHVKDCSVTPVIVWI